MKCPICGNEERFIIINHEQCDAKYQKESDRFILTNPKILSADFYCGSEECKGKMIKINKEINKKEAL
ncbi:MAG: hypothetical protein ACFFG0_56865 [Candidatus Thorarchaeota archaeon]